MAVRAYKHRSTIYIHRMLLCSNLYVHSLRSVDYIPLHPTIAAEYMDALYSLEFHMAITRMYIRYHHARYSTGQGSITMGECLKHDPEDDTHVHPRCIILHCMYYKIYLIACQLTVQPHSSQSSFDLRGSSLCATKACSNKVPQTV